MKIYLSIVIGSILISCSTVQKPTPEVIKDSTELTTVVETAPKDDKTLSENIKIKAQIGELKNGDPFQLERVICEGNTLFISLSYGGGCGEHSFQFNANMLVMTSWPPKRSVQLIHTNHKDYCKAIVQKTIEVDLVELANIKKRGSTTILLLDGWDKPIEYTFE
jgi:hypothetical protein